MPDSLSIRKRGRKPRWPILRGATSADACAIVTILIESRRAYLPFAPMAHPPEDVRRWVAEELLPSGGVTVAELDGLIVGVLATSTDHAGSWIDQLYLRPGYPGRGIGTLLLDHAHASLPRPVRLYTFQENLGARRFYERHGYVAIAWSDGRDNEERCPDVLYRLDAE